MREKLIDLLSKVQYLGGLEEKIADHLIANGVTVQKWIPVYKKLPKKGQPVLVRSAVGGDSIGEYRGSGIWFDLVFRADNVTHGHGGYEYGITHWADQTQPPKGE